MNLTTICLFLFIFFSFYTHTIQDLKSSPILGRMTVGDIFGILTIAFALIQRHYIIDKIGKGALIFCLSLFIGVFFSYNFVQSFVETNIHLMLVLIFIAGSTILATDNGFKNLLTLIAITTIVAASSAIYENSLHLTGLPTMYPKADLRDFKAGSFRNSGQAGAYFMIMLAILIPVKYSSYKLLTTKRMLSATTIAIYTSVIAIIMTVKISSLIGVAVGLTLLCIRKARPALIVPIILGCAIFYFGGEALSDLFPTLASRINSKTNSRLDIDAQTSEDSFFSHNWGAALVAFEHNPIFGSGIGGFHGTFSSHEVHSTPLKLLGETGVVGILGYLIFVLSIISSIQIINSGRYPCHYKDYISVMTPLLIGCAVSWIYTYHMRKREFWILLIVLSIAITLSLRNSVQFRLKLRKQRTTPQD